MLDPEAQLFSYLDDTYLVVSKDLLLLALTGLAEAVRPFGLELNPRKTFVWSPSGAAGLPDEAAAHWTDSLPVLGAHLRCRGDAEDAPLTLGAGATSLKDATSRLQQLWAQLQRLQKAGLSKQAGKVCGGLRTLAVLRMLVQVVLQYL